MMLCSRIVPSLLLKFSVFFIVLLPSYCDLEGPNVCTIQETYTKQVNVTESKAYQIKEYTICLTPPTFHCSKYRVGFRPNVRVETVVKTRPVEVCCTGYARSKLDRCVPVCSNECEHGTCIAPETCQCTTGYGGETCNFNFLYPFPENPYFILLVILWSYEGILTACLTLLNKTR